MVTEGVEVAKVDFFDAVNVDGGVMAGAVANVHLSITTISTRDIGVIRYFVVMVDLSFSFHIDVDVSLVSHGV